MKNELVIQIITKFISPFILLFGFYVQIHGEFTPGGGFQAGAILASVFILYIIIFGKNHVMSFFPLHYIKRCIFLGTALYAFTGLFSLIKGKSLLDYSALWTTPVEGQKIGIMVVELGILITVWSSLLLIFLSFIMRKDH